MGEQVFNQQHRKTRPFLGLADILLIGRAFEVVRRARQAMPFERAFYLKDSVSGVLLLVQCPRKKWADHFSAFSSAE